MIAVIGLGLSAGAVQALTDEEIFREFRFNFINAGPRAMGMGGAFVGISDDVTAINANPGGLARIDAPEFFAEFRSIDADRQIISGDSGSLDVDPVTGARELPFFSVTSVSEPDSVEELTFVGGAWPFAWGSSDRRLTVMGSRQVVLSDDRALSGGGTGTETRFAFESFPNTVGGGGVEAYSIRTPVSGGSSMEIIYWSVGAALEVHPDFSFGYTISYATLDITSSAMTEVIDPLELFVDPAHPRLPSEPTSDIFMSSIDDTDDGFAYTIGIHWQPSSVFASGRSPWRVGAVYRRGADFQVQQATLLNGVEDDNFVNRIAVPDRFSIGLGYDSDPNWTVSVELERIDYTDLLEGFRSGVNYLTSGRVADGAFGIDPDASIEYDIDDAYVPRLGAEYRHPSRSGRDREAAFRLGYYRSADDRVRMTSFNSDDPDINDVYLDAFAGGDEENHVTAGFGYTLGRSTLQIAGDFAGDATQIVGSYSYILGSKAVQR